LACLLRQDKTVRHIIAKPLNGLGYCLTGVLASTPWSAEKFTLPKALLYKAVESEKTQHPYGHCILVSIYLVNHRKSEH
jgi:hypothetical protein